MNKPPPDSGVGLVLGVTAGLVGVAALREWLGQRGSSVRPGPRLAQRPADEDEDEAEAEGEDEGLSDQDRRELEAERDDLLRELSARGGRGIDLAEKIDEINALLGEEP
jgi:hypothetical protein